MQDPDYDATAFAFLVDETGKTDEFGPTTLARAVRLVMEQVPEALRGQAWVRTATGELRGADLDALYHREDFPRM